MAAAPRLIGRAGNQLFDISFEANLKEVEDTLFRHERWVVPYAASSALSATAYDAMQAEKARIAGVFDRPTAWTLKGVLYEKANKDRLTYRIYLRDFTGRGSAPADYLGPQVRGGMRGAKPFEMLLKRIGVLRAGEFTVPGRGQALDAYGNLGARKISKILSFLGARRDPLQNTTARSRKRNKKLGQFFVVRGNRTLPDGIYERLDGRSIKLVLYIVETAPRYRPRYPFGEAARTKAIRVFGPHFKRYFDQLRARG